MPAASSRPDAHRAPALDALRGASVLAVIVGHALHVGLDGAPRWLANVLDPALAVGLFFALSGYLVAASVERDRGPRRWPRMLIVRGCRLFVPFALAWAFYALPLYGALVPGGFFRQPSAEPIEVALSLALADGWLPPTGPGVIVPGSWSISAEWLAALTFIPLALALRSPRATLFAAVALALAGQAALALAQLAAPLPPAAHVWALAHGGTFAAGVWAFRAAQRDARTPAAERRLLLAGVIAVLLAGMAVGMPSLLPGAGLLSGVLVWRVARCSSPPGPPSQALAWLGARSYGAYLFHFAGLAIAWRLLGAALHEPVGLISLIVAGLVAGVAGGALLLPLVERPAIRAGRRAADRLFPRASAT